MLRPTIALEVLDIKNPCPADWNDMRGDERVRFCKHCSLHVYNLSAMTRDAAQQLISEREGRVCIRMYRRADGTVITRDCGGALKLAAKRISRLVTTGSAVVLSGVLAAIGWSRSASASPTEKCDPPLVSPRAIMGDLVAPTPLMGKIAAPATQPVVK